MSYVKTTWTNGVTPLNATNMNKIEDGIYSAQNTADNASSSISALQTAVEGKVDKVAGTSGDIVTFGSNGAVADSGKQIETSLSTSSDSKVPTSKAVATHVTSAIATKANKVSSTTADHFVSFSDADGTLKDSGKSASDFSKVVAVTGTASGTALTGLTVDGTSYTIPQEGLSPITPANNTTALYSATNTSGTTTQGSKTLVKSVSNPASDDNVLTEKAVADNFVKTVITPNRIYGTNVQGVQSYYTVSAGTGASTLAYRGTGGTLQVGTPTEDAHAATKRYVDSFVVANDNSGSSGGPLSTIKINGVSYTIETLPCLIAGTKILMSDGTEKSIEDVISGDLIKSYDPVNKELVDAIVIDSYKTGEENQFTHYTYSNGSSLNVYGTHGYYDVVQGIPKDMKTQKHETKVLDSSLEECVLIDKRPVGKYGEKVARYNLISSNNLYFANGILLGGRAIHKYQYCLRTNKEMPENVRAIMSQDCEDYNDFMSVIDNPQFILEAKDAFIASSRAYSIIKADKEKLEKTDYKTLKHTEGKLSEEEYAEALEEREALRQEINEQQSIYLTNLRIIKQLKTQYRNGVTERSLFETCCTRDNEALQLFKDWLQPKGE